MAQLVKNSFAMRETWVRSLGWEDPLEKRKATHYSILAWRILWTVQSMGVQRIGHDSDFDLWASLVAQLVKNPCLQCRRREFDPWVGKIAWRREQLPTLVF